MSGLAAYKSKPGYGVEAVAAPTGYVPGGHCGAELPDPVIGVYCINCEKDMIRPSPSEPIQGRIVEGGVLCVRCR